MHRFKILSGDFLHGKGVFQSGVLSIETALYPWPGLNIKADELKNVSIVNEEYSVNPKVAVGLGLAGALTLGPLGAAAAMVMAGQERDLSFLATLRDGRTFLGLADLDSYEALENHVRKQALRQRFQQQDREEPR
jgi:hypothetical protein